VLCVAAFFVTIAAVAVTIWRRADNALADLQQADPRQRTTQPLPALPSVTPVGGQLPATLMPFNTQVAATSLPLDTENLPETLKRPFTVLLIGVDIRPTALEGVRSDTLILVRIDPVQQWASMLSIPRDSVVQIPNIGWEKINTAYSFGYNNAEAIYGAGTEQTAAGAALAAETVEQFLGVTIDYTAQVDFEGFERIVDTLGGLVVDVQAPLLDSEYPTEDFGYQRIYIPSGLQVLDGRTALIYARTRHGSSDFERSKRQQQVLRSLLTQVRERGLFENAALLPQWADVLRQSVRTTLPIRDFSFLNGLALLASDLKSNRIQQLSINPNDVGIDHEDGSNIYWNASDIAILVDRWQQGPPE
jgi:LCP family protein required for cell wall assembly